MTEKKADGVWMANGNAKALVPSADVDAWKPRGWAESDEPADDGTADTDFVWMRNADTGGVAPIAWGARDYHQAVGWSPSAPADPVDLTRDPHLRDASANKDSPDKPAKAAKTAPAKADDPKEK